MWLHNWATGHYALMLDCLIKFSMFWCDSLEGSLLEQRLAPLFQPFFYKDSWIMFYIKFPHSNIKIDWSLNMIYYISRILLLELNFLCFDVIVLGLCSNHFIIRTVEIGFYFKFPFPSLKIDCCLNIFYSIIMYLFYRHLSHSIWALKHLKNMWLHNWATEHYALMLDCFDSQMLRCSEALMLRWCLDA